MEFNREVTYRLSELMKARFPYIYISTYEEERAVEMVTYTVKQEALIKTVRKVYIWTQTDGLVCTDDNKAVGKNTTQPVEAINFIDNCREDAVFILKDFHVFFGQKNRTPDYGVIRKLRDIIPGLKRSAVKKNVVFITPELNVPDDMQKEISVFDFPLPTVDEIKAKLDQMITDNVLVESDIDEEGKERLAKAAVGLTMQEAENCFARAMVRDRRISMEDLPIIFEEKNQAVKKTGILEFVKSVNDISDIGGLENLKRWLQKRNNSWLDSAKTYNIPTPKGVLITGVPGCGKSLTAKAMSTIWQLPLLKLDMGRIFSGIVGSSEENMRRAIETAEAVAPSILWVDEIEKGLSGSNSTGDSGVGARIFGTFLTWMQDKTAPVFVIATANNISSLPPELLRKGRFDEIFFVDLPTVNERKVIFEIHLKKRLENSSVSGKIMVDGKIPEEILTQLAEQTEGFVGAEIEQIVISALYEAFFEQRALELKDLQTVISNMVPLSVTQKEQIRALRDWANVRAVAATAKEDMREYDTDNEAAKEGDINESRGGRTIDF